MFSVPSNNEMELVDACMRRQRALLCLFQAESILAEFAMLTTVNRDDSTSLLCCCWCICHEHLASRGTLVQARGWCPLDIEKEWRGPRRIANGNSSGDARLITCCPLPSFLLSGFPFERLFPAPCIMVSHVSFLLVMKWKAFLAAMGKLPCGTALSISADCSCLCLACFIDSAGPSQLLSNTIQLLSIQSDTKLWLPLTLHLGILIIIFLLNTLC